MGNENEGVLVSSWCPGTWRNWFRDVSSPYFTAEFPGIYEKPL